MTMGKLSVLLKGAWRQRGDYREKAKVMRPDLGRTHDAMTRLNEAKRQLSATKGNTSPPQLNPARP
jgi:hypothetical protein